MTITGEITRPVVREGMLLVVDAQNLYYSARELFGRGSRIDFKKLKSLIVGDRQFSVVYGVAYVPELRDTTKGDAKSLVRALQRFGYETVSREADFDHQVGELSSIAPTFQVIAIASGDGAFLPLCETARANGQRVEVYSFMDSANSEIPGKVDEFVYLKATVLMGDFATIVQTETPDETKPAE